MTTKRVAGRTAAPTRRELVLPETVTVKQLAEMLGVSPIEVIKQLMRQGVMAAINQAIDYSIASLVTPAFGYHAKKEEPKPTLRAEALRQAQSEEDPSKLQPRSPVVTILGHVDHGKTSLLDAIRKTKVAEGEAGGITQHIGAYQVSYKDQTITFIDTPGHEAFTAMRARGAQVTDIAILVVAADDGVMPQTVEALNHARAAGVPIIVAINKIDKPGANLDRVKSQLAEHNLVLEEWGGDTMAVPVSAKTGAGLQDLLESIVVQAEVLELKANPDRAAQGVVLEARMDKTRGPLATVLVQRGTLRPGDIVVAGTRSGRVKAMLNDLGRRIKEAGPSMPVEILGLDGVPEAGDLFIAVPDERTARQLVESRRQEQEAERTHARALSLEEVSAQVTTGEVKQVSLIIKTDVQGSVEAIRSALEKLAASTDKVSVQVIHADSGSINESDVLLASASKAIILGFNTRVEPGARRLADSTGVDIRQYDIIYKMLEDVEQAVKGALQPTEREIIEGHAEVRAVFPSGRGKVAGVVVRDGRVVRNAMVRVKRGDQVLHEGRMTGLRRFKEDVTEVTQGFECGIGVDGFSDFQEGDVLEVFRRERPRVATS